MIKEKVIPEKLIEDVIAGVYELVLFNDDFNDFDYVIEALIDVCEVDPIQAEQITLIVHSKGKCGVVSGSIEELKPKYNVLSQKGLTVSIE